MITIGTHYKVKNFRMIHPYFIKKKKSTRENLCHPRCNSKHKFLNIQLILGVKQKTNNQ